MEITYFAEITLQREYLQIRLEYSDKLTQRDLKHSKTILFMGSLNIQQISLFALTTICGT